MSLLILLRHGQSMWNLENVFTGWVDVPLSPKGIQEALDAGKQLADIAIDKVYVSTLERAMMTAMLALSEHNSGRVPVIAHSENTQLAEWGNIYDEASKRNALPVEKASELNERMYGELQGLNKDETREKYGKEQVKIWRRSFSTRPPEGESLEMTAARTLPYFNDVIVPDLQLGKNLLVSAHGNSLRAIMMELDGLSEEEVVNLEIPTGKPIIYYYAKGKFKKEE
jgi:2,3-bisphosphoglycerate-dependent phosphoglycerate mutase